MSEFKPDKLTVTYKNDIGINGPIVPRYYTLTHSDLTGQLFLVIAKKYDTDSITEMRDEVLGEWNCNGNNCTFNAFVQVDGNATNLAQVIIRNSIIRKELPLALKAIFYGDVLLLENYNKLNDANIIVHFISNYPEYKVDEDYGKVSVYKYMGNSLVQRDLVKPIINNPLYQQFVPYHNEYSNEISYPAPIVTPIPIPIDGKVESKCRIIEMALLNLLNNYIENEIDSYFGKGTPYCLKKCEVLEARKVNINGPCTDEYEIVIGLKVGRRPPIINNMIITFLISEDRIVILNSKSLT